MHTTATDHTSFGKGTEGDVMSEGEHGRGREESLCRHHSPLTQ